MTPQEQRCGVDFSRPSGCLRPLNGVNNGPNGGDGCVDVTPFYKAAGFPFARLHDCNWPHPNVVDIPAIFPDFSRDPDDPANYNFVPTDDYLKAILDCGTQVVYRLGTSIEHSPRKYHTHPPTDYAKWARIATHIVRHFNDGWANGFHHRIQYWEIWNEPDIGAMWSGTREQYYELYAAAARELKAVDRSLKVGGPGLSSDNELRVGLLKYCRDHEIPMDFHSWHAYGGDPAALLKNAIQVRHVLDEHGFTQTESHLNEWNYMPGEWPQIMSPNFPRDRRAIFARITGHEGAAFAASGLIHLQDAPLDMANYYTGDCFWWGLFDGFGVPHKTYYAFLAFKWLLGTPVRATIDAPDGTLCAGLSEDGRQAGVLISNFAAAPRELTMDLRGLPAGQPLACEKYLLDASHDLELVETETITGGLVTLRENLPSYSVSFYRLRPA